MGRINKYRYKRRKRTMSAAARERTQFASVFPEIRFMGLAIISHSAGQTKLPLFPLWMREDNDPITEALGGLVTTLDVIGLEAFVPEPPRGLGRPPGPWRPRPSFRGQGRRRAGGTQKGRVGQERRSG